MNPAEKFHDLVTKMTHATAHAAYLAHGMDDEEMLSALLACVLDDFVRVICLIAEADEQDALVLADAACFRLPDLIKETLPHTRALLDHIEQQLNGKH